MAVHEPAGHRGGQDLDLADPAARHAARVVAENDQVGQLPRGQAALLSPALPGRTEIPSVNNEGPRCS